MVPRKGYLERFKTIRLSGLGQAPRTVTKVVGTAAVASRSTIVTTCLPYGTIFHLPLTRILPAI
jgi:hypothetical protein